MVAANEESATDRDIVPWTGRDVVAATVAVIAGVVAVLILMKLSIALFDGIDADDLRPWALVFVEGLMVLAVWVFAVRRRGASMSSLGFRPTGSRATYVWPLAVLIASLASTALYAAAVSGLGLDLLEPPELTEDLFGTGLERTATVLAIVVWGPFAEELFFRGFVLAALVAPLGPARAAVVSSALFAVAHVSIGVVVPIFLTGLMLSWLYLRTRSIWPPITAHALQNFVAVTVVL